MMCYYLNVHFQGQRIKVSAIIYINTYIYTHIDKENTPGWKMNSALVLEKNTHTFSFLTDLYFKLGHLYTA